MQTCPGFFSKSLLESPGNLLEICSVKFVDTLQMHRFHGLKIKTKLTRISASYRHVLSPETGEYSCINGALFVHKMWCFDSSHQPVPSLPSCHVFMFVLMPDAGTMSSDVAEADTSMPVHHCTVCRCKIDVSKPDSAYQHSLLSVLLCKVCVNSCCICSLLIR